VQRFIDYPRHFADLRECIDIMLASSGSKCILFGNHPLDHHRIAIMETAGGTQIGFHASSTWGARRSFSSGQYLRMEPGFEDKIVALANEYLQRYYQDHPNRALNEMIWAKRDRDNFHYYTADFQQ